MSGDPLARFVEAQDPLFADVIAELKAGRKKTHWMWFIFPQIAGLGMSAMSQRYAIADLSEAGAYLAHATLGPRLREATSAVMSHVGKGPTIHRIFGSPDDMKFQSSMTLFRAAAPSEALFGEALRAWYDGHPCAATLERL